jgi:hypothetical protein
MSGYRARFGSAGMVEDSINRSISLAANNTRRPSLTRAIFRALAHCRTVTGRSPSLAATSSTESSVAMFVLRIEL